MCVSVKQYSTSPNAVLNAIITISYYKIDFNRNGTILKAKHNLNCGWSENSMYCGC